MTPSAQTPLVSAVIPTTLGERRLPFIYAAIESVLQQRSANVELILVHNGTGPELRKHVERYLPHIKYSYLEFGNIGAARNRGVEEASGKYVAFLDDDDLWQPEKVCRQAAAMESNPDVDVTFTDMELFTEAGVIHESYVRHIGGVDQLSMERRSDSFSVQRGSWFEYLIANLPFLPSVWMGKRDVFARAPFLPKPSEDREVLWRISREYKLGYLNEVLTRKRDHGANASISHLDACISGIIEHVGAAYAWPLTPSELTSMRRWEAQAHFDLGYIRRKQGRFADALRHHASSLTLAPRASTAKELVKSAIRWRGRDTADA
jgi:hypothetical protein